MYIFFLASTWLWTSRSIFFFLAVVVVILSPPPLQFHLVAVELFSEISYAVPGFGCSLASPDAHSVMLIYIIFFFARSCGMLSSRFHRCGRPQQPHVQSVIKRASLTRTMLHISFFFFTQKRYLLQNIFLSPPPLFFYHRREMIAFTSQND